MGIAHRTYASYERNERVPDAEALIPLLAEGWNANWLLTGEGPERLEALQVAESHAGYGSHVLKPEGLTVAIQLVAEALDAQDRELPPAKYAKVVSLAYELLDGDMPRANVLRFVLAAVA